MPVISENRKKESQTVDHSTQSAELADTQPRQEDVTEQTISRAIGQELRRTRESRGWSRNHFVSRLPSGIGERTLLSYENGTRQLSVLRLLEVCRGLGVAAPGLLNDALQRARISLSNLVLRINLRHLLNDANDDFKPLVRWARNCLEQSKDEIAELTPATVSVLADFIGCSHVELAAHLAQFIPDRPQDRVDQGALL